jgi:hypothetical protein
MVRYGEHWQIDLKYPLIRKGKTIKHIARGNRHKLFPAHLMFHFTDCRAYRAARINTSGALQLMIGSLQEYARSSSTYIRIGACRGNALVIGSAGLAFGPFASKPGQGATILSAPLGR